MFVVVVVVILKHQSPEALKLIKINHGFVQLILAAMFGYYSNNKP